MADQKKNSPVLTSQFDGLWQALSSQSIIDVFVVQGLIIPTDAEKIKQRYRNNLAIERFLLANKLLSREAINKAYSIILKLPFISLGNLAIPEKTLRIIPDKIARKYLVVPFGLKDKVLNLAVGSPGEIFLPQNRNLETLTNKSDLTLELFVSTPDDILSILSRSRQKGGVLLTQGSLPVIFLRNRNIPLNCLRLLPLDFVKRYRLAIFEQLGDKKYRIAIEDPYNSKTKEIVAYIIKNNDLELEQFATSASDIDYIISLYSKNLQADKTAPVEKSAGQEKNESDEDFGGLRQIVDSVIPSSGPQITMETEKKSDVSPKTTGENVVPQSTREDVVKYEMEATKRSEEEERDIGKLLGGREIRSLQEVKKIAEENSIPKLVAGLISYSLFLGASDIHLEPEAKRLRVRCRVDGVLRDLIQLPAGLGPQITSRVKILGAMKLDETRIPQDGRFSVDFRDRAVDVRVSVLPTVFGEKTVMRILDKSQGILSLEDLGFVGSAFKIIMEQIKMPYGIVLATGPTGSGKTTTLYAILNRINQPGVNVVTLEDPVEYEIPGVNQCQIKPKIGFSFAEGLRSILRQDPNIIMVGEVRDSDTAGMATHAALTGHLVLTSLHTNDAASALPRLINMGIEPFLITSSVNLIIAQRLVRRICLKCREKTDIPPVLKQQVEAELKAISEASKEDLARVKKELQFYKGKGCNQCSGGYKGRIGIYELLVMNDQIESLAVSRRPASEIKEAAMKSGMLTMRQDGILKALDGLTTIDEVLLTTGSVGGDNTIGSIIQKVQIAPDTTEDNATKSKPADK